MIRNLLVYIEVEKETDKYRHVREHFDGMVCDDLNTFKDSLSLLLPDGVIYICGNMNLYDDIVFPNDVYCVRWYSYNFTEADEFVELEDIPLI